MFGIRQSAGQAEAADFSGATDAGNESGEAHIERLKIEKEHHSPRHRCAAMIKLELRQTKDLRLFEQGGLA